MLNQKANYIIRKLRGFHTSFGDKITSIKQTKQFLIISMCINPENDDSISNRTLIDAIIAYDLMNDAIEYIHVDKDFHNYKDTIKTIADRILDSYIYEFHKWLDENENN